MNRWIVAALAIVSFSVVGCVDRKAQAEAKETEKFVSNVQKSVVVETVKPEILVEQVEVTGDVTTTDDTQVGAKSPGRLVEVLVRDGDTVTSGQIIAQQDTTSLSAQLVQARSSVATAKSSLATAQSSLAQARQNALINPQKSRSGVLTAEAQLRSAKSQLQKALNGSRPEERRQAEANVASAKTNLDTQRKELDRIKTLVTEGALAGNRLDQQLTTYQNALTQYTNAQESLSVARNATRPEDLETAREQVRQAEEQLRTAKSNKQLDSLYADQVLSAQAQVQSAKAQIQNAQAQVTIAQQAIADATIRAPFNGKVSGKPAQVGTILGSGGVVVRLIGQQGLYFEGSVPSDNISKLDVGAQVEIEVTALGSAKTRGTVAAISPQGSNVGRLFTVRIQIPTPPAGLRPGMFVRGLVTARSIPNALVVPASSVIDRGDEKYVVVAANGKAKKKTVKLLLAQGSRIQVEGLAEGDQVVVEGQRNLVDGDVLKIEPAKATGAAQ